METTLDYTNAPQELVTAAFAEIVADNAEVDQAMSNYLTANKLTPEQAEALNGVSHRKIAGGWDGGTGPQAGRN